MAGTATLRHTSHCLRQMGKKRSVKRGNAKY
jgi:hypothetical protein